MEKYWCAKISWNPSDGIGGPPSDGWHTNQTSLRRTAHPWRKPSKYLYKIGVQVSFQGLSIQTRSRWGEKGKCPLLIKRQDKRRFLTQNWKSNNFWLNWFVCMETELWISYLCLYLGLNFCLRQFLLGGESFQRVTWEHSFLLKTSSLCSINEPPDLKELFDKGLFIKSEAPPKKRWAGLASIAFWRRYKRRFFGGGVPYNYKEYSNMGKLWNYLDCGVVCIRFNANWAQGPTVWGADSLHCLTHSALNTVHEQLKASLPNRWIWF